MILTPQMASTQAPPAGQTMFAAGRIAPRRSRHKLARAAAVLRNEATIALLGKRARTAARLVHEAERIEAEVNALDRARWPNAVAMDDVLRSMGGEG